MQLLYLALGIPAEVLVYLLACRSERAFLWNGVEHFYISDVFGEHQEEDQEQANEDMPEEKTGTAAQQLVPAPGTPAQSLKRPSLMEVPLGGGSRRNDDDLERRSMQSEHSRRSMRSAASPCPSRLARLPWLPSTWSFTFLIKLAF